MQTKYMRECIALAQKSAAEGGYAYAAAIVDPQRAVVLATGRNQAGANPIWHGEMSAITNLSMILGATPVLSVAKDFELYTTGEPCAMCMGAIVWSGFGRVYYGSSIPFIESQGMNQIEIRAWEVNDASPWQNITIIGGVLSNETDLLYVGGGPDRKIMHHDHGHDHKHGHWH